MTREILLRQIESVLDELSKDAQCIVCEEYFDRKSMLKATEGGLLCPACYEKHYVVCFDCNKLTERRKAKYHTDLAYCPTCYLWMQHMGFV